jgi:hypothetical protein
MLDNRRYTEHSTTIICVPHAHNADDKSAETYSCTQITLIDQSERFVFKPLLYEVVNGGALPDEVAPSFARLLAPYAVNFLQVPRMSPLPHPPDNCMYSSLEKCALVELNENVAADWYVNNYRPWDDAWHV